VDAFVREGTTKSFNPWPGANKDSVRNRSTAALTIPLRPKLLNVVLLVLVLLVLVLLVLVLVLVLVDALASSSSSSSPPPKQMGTTLWGLLGWQNPYVMKQRPLEWLP
jgi:hypothetical protein